MNLMELPTWPISVACAWIECRSPELLEAFYGDALQPILAAGFTQLRQKLFEGEIESTGLTKNRKRSVIPARDWQDIEFSYDLTQAEGLLPRAHAVDETYTNVTVSRLDVLRLWREQSEGSQPAGTAADEKRAIEAASAILREDQNIPREELHERLKALGITVSAIGLKERLLPAARIKAGLPPAGKPGRRPKDKSVTP